MSDPIPTWQECHDAGMTAREAAEARGRHQRSAQSWARSRGLKWPLPLVRGTSCPVSAKGKVYPSARAAARALKVCESTVIKHLREYGHLELVGKLRAGAKKGAKPRNRKPITVGGRTFQTRRELAAYVGYTEQYLSRVLSGRDGQGPMERLIAAVMRADAQQANQRMRRVGRDDLNDRRAA